MSENTRYTTTDQLANVPHPAGATKVDDWFNPDALIGTIVSYVGPDTARSSRAHRGSLIATTTTRASTCPSSATSTWTGVCNAISWFSSTVTSRSPRARPASSLPR